MQTDTSLEAQLKDAVKLTDAAWAVVAERVGGTWLLRDAYRLNKSAHPPEIRQRPGPGKGAGLPVAVEHAYHAAP